MRPILDAQTRLQMSQLNPQVAVADGRSCVEHAFLEVTVYGGTQSLTPTS